MKTSLKKYHIAMFLAILWLALPASLFSAPSFRITLAASGSTVSSYTADATIADVITIVHKKDANVASYGFSTGVSGNYATRYASDPISGDTINYQIYDNLTNRNIVTDNVNSPSDWFFTYTFPYGSGAGNTINTNFIVEVPSGQFPAAGDYIDTVTMNIYADTGGGNVWYASDDYEIDITVNSVTQLALVETGLSFDEASTSHTTNIPELLVNETGTFDMMVRSNALYTIEMSSQNSGVMKLTSNPLDPTDISYQVSVNGDPSITLTSTPTTVIPNGSRSTYAGNRYPVVFTITNVPETATLGDYNDIISISVIAN